LCLAAALVLGIVLPSPASAQWYLDGTIGANHNLDADVSIRQASTNLALDFHDVRFAAEANYPRRYYTARLGRLVASGRLGVEFELIHLKAVGDTSRAYEVTAASGTALPAAGASPMNLVVQEFRMTHGVNLGLVNVVIRQPLGRSGSGPVSLAVRLGAGASFPFAESTVNGESVHQYEYGGPGAQAAVGLHIRTWGRVAAVTEYKLTYTRPRIDIAGGTAWTTLVSHHVVVGISIGLTR
jgi:hypothetical protein